MLRQILKSIRSFLAALPRFVVEKVWAGGRWITRLVAAPAPAAEPDVEPAPVSDDGDLQHVYALRTAAAHLAAGQIPPEAASERLRPFDVEWLMAMPRPMLCRVATASDSALRAHLRRQRPMPGLLASEPGAVRDYKHATKIERIRISELKEEALSPA